MPKSIAKLIVFSSVDCVGCWCISGCIFVMICVVFSGLATTDRETPRYVKFVDSIEKINDFQKRRATNSETSRKFNVLEYVVFGASFRAACLSIWGSFGGSFLA